MRKFFYAIIAVLLLLLAMDVVFQKIIPIKVRKGQETGDIIVLALEAYKNDHGRYPERLAELAPDHLAVIPQPKLGLRDWEYKYFAQTGQFQLSSAFNDEGYPSIYYVPDSSGWRFDH